MEMKRRNFLHLSTLAVGTIAMNSCTPAQERSPETTPEQLKPMTDKLIPISLKERQGKN
jgi:hypothetical protein